MKREVVVALVLLTLGATLSAAAAGLANEGPPAGRFTVPARWASDSGTYNITIVGDQDAPERQRIFEVQPLTSVLGSDGEPFGTMPVREAWLIEPKPGDLRERWHIAMDDGLTPAVSERWTARSSFAGLRCSAGGLVPCITVSVAENALYEIDTESSQIAYFQTGGLCGLRNEAQGNPIDLGAKALFLGDCATPNLKAIRETSLPGHPRVIVFSGKQDGRLTQVWLSSDVPYPLRVWSGDANGSATAYSLSEFHRGIDAEPAPLTKPPIQLPRGEPRQASGPDTSGLDLPWPLATALEQARSQALSPLAEYEAAHPEAQLAAAALTESTNGHYRQRTWTVQFVGTQSFGLGIHLDENEDGEPSTTSLFYSRNPQAAVNGDFYLQVIDPDPDLAPLANLPTHLPSVAEALVVYEAFRPSNGPEWDANAWSFAITCPPPCEGEAKAWVSAGLYREFSDEVGPTQRFGVEPLSEMRTHVLMAASQIGQLAFVDQTDAVRKPYDHLPPTNPAEAPAWTIASRSEGYAWSNPQPLAALSTGLALVVAAIALLAHALRHGGLGLFTRIAPHALANHPTRAAILDAVNMSPGIHFSRLARQVDLAPGALQHHVTKLVESGLVTKLARTGRTHYFPAGTTQQSAAQAATASIPGAAEILAAIRIHAGLSVSDLASQTGRTVGTVSHHLNHLEREGLIERRRMGRKVAVYPCF